VKKQLYTHRMCRIVLLVLVVAALAACGAGGGTAPWEPVSAAEVEKMREPFETISSAYEEAFRSRDVEAMRALHTDDVVHHDATFGVHTTSFDELARELSDIFTSFPTQRSQVRDLFIGSGVSLVLLDTWNVTVRGHEFTRDDPALHVLRWETRGDRISHETMSYGLETMDHMLVASIDRLDAARSLLAAYGSAWSSGDASSCQGEE
jgi:ketosteroid isomerase-like protein